MDAVTQVKHTPGPWIAIPATNRWHGNKPIFSDGLWHVLPEADVERLPICSIDHADDHSAAVRKHSENDARLIAAAPELYEALVAIESCLAPDDNDYAAQKVRAALAKVSVPRATAA